MQTPASASLSVSAFALATATDRFTPPAHVKRWTGRAVPTIFLPDLAALRLSAFASPRNSAQPARN